MAAGTASLIIGGVVAGASIYQGEKQRKAGQKSLEEFERQELNNVFEDVPISTYGSDLLIEQNNIQSASATQAAQEAGIRGVLGAIPKIQAQTNRNNQQAAQLIDDQVIDRNYNIAQDNRRIQGVQENRDNAELAGIGNQIDVGRQQTLAGIRGLGNVAISGFRNGQLGNGNSNVSSTVGANPIGSAKPFYNDSTLDQIFRPSQAAISALGVPDYMSDFKMFEPKPYEI